MSRKVKKVISHLIAVIMLVSLIPSEAFATTVEHVGTYGGLLHSYEEQFADDLLSEGLLERDMLIENVLEEDLFAEGLEDDMFFYLEPCEQIFFEEPLYENFEDNAVVIVLTRAASRDNRTFTVQMFSDVDAIYVEDLDRLSEQESVYGEQLWEAERNMALVRANLQTLSIEAEEIYQEVYQAYVEARVEAEENTLVNFDEYRRILLIRLNQSCKENVLRVIRLLEQREYIHLVAPNYISEPDEILPDDYYFQLPSNHASHQWAVERLSLPQAWGVTTGSSEVRVGILGHGIDAHHPELRGRIRALECGSLTELNTGTDGGPGYGTRQAGIIGAMGNNSIGVAGIAWNVQIYSVAVGATFGGHANGIANARQAGIPILSRSFTRGELFQETVFQAVRNYTGLFVNGAGNESIDRNESPKFPDLSNAIVVGASNQNDARRPYSNFGSTSVHLFAPSQVQTTHPNNMFGRYGGTSAATPHVAGVAALVLSINPDLSPAEVRDIILDNVDPIEEFSDISISGGRLNANRAVRVASQNQNQVTVTLHAGGEGAWDNVPDGWTQAGAGTITHIQRKQAPGSAVVWPENPTWYDLPVSSWSPERPSTWPRGDAKFVAQWPDNQITVTLNAGTGGAWGSVPSGWTQVGTGAITQIQREQATGSAISWPVNPTRFGFSLSSWSPTRPATWPSEVTTYTARWTARAELVIPILVVTSFVNYIDGNMIRPQTFINTIPSESGVISISVDSYIHAQPWRISNWSISYSILDQNLGFVRHYSWQYEGETVGVDNILTHRLPTSIDLHSSQWSMTPVFRVYVEPITLVDRTVLEQILAEAALMTQADFSVANWRVFVSSRNHAQAVLTDIDSSQIAINNAANNLRNLVNRAIRN